MPVRRACATGLRTNATSRVPGRATSATKQPRPRRCRASSLRSRRAPMPKVVRGAGLVSTVIAGIVIAKAGPHKRHGRSGEGMHRAILAGFFATVFWMATAAAQEPTRLKLSLEFRPYGGTAATINTEVGGFFKAEGLEVKVDGSSGSGDAITRVAAGSYDIGIADIGALVEFAARNPAAAPKVVMLLFDRGAHVIVALKKSGIAKPADLMGKRLVTGQADATVRIFPSFLKLNGIDGTRITQ